MARLVERRTHRVSIPPVKLYSTLVALLLLAATASAEPPDFFAPGRAFEPLPADPRWPSFNIGYSNVLKGDGVVFDPDRYDDLWNASFGDTIAFVRAERFEVGAQAALFAVFDLGDPSQPLINADYQGGVYGATRLGPWSGLARIYHQSSHLGDELLLYGPPLSRTNASHDSVEFLGSRDLLDGDLRLYAGGGVVVNQTGRGDFGDFVLQYGGDYEATRLAFRAGSFQLVPFAAVDLQHLEGRDYQLDFSGEAGLRLSDGPGPGGRLDLVLTYYNGRNPNGQFFVSDLETFGVNIRVSL